MATERAKAGDVVYRMGCKCNHGRDGVLVRRSMSQGWKCARCHRPGRCTHVVTLGPGGIIPNPEEWVSAT